MMSQCSAELCTLLVEDNFGELFAVSHFVRTLGVSCDTLRQQEKESELTSSLSQRIFTVLHRYERLTLPRLRFFARLPERQLLNGLAAMIQHHLIYHFTSLDDGNTYYEANPHAAYSLVRSGKILHLVETRLGEYAARVLEKIMSLGHTSIAHLETLPELRPRTQRIPNGVDHPETEADENGEIQEVSDEPSGDHAVSEKPARLHPTLKSLASHGYIHRVREAHFQSPNDNWLDATRIIGSRADVKQMKGKQQAAEIEEKAKELVKQRMEGDLSRGLMYNGLPHGVKRKRDHANGVSHQQATNGSNGVNGDHAEDDDEENDWSEDEDGFSSVPMDSNLIIRVNYEKLDVALRNLRFLELAAECAPPVSVEVYDCLLRRIEYQTSRCRDTYEIPREGEEGEQYSAPIELKTLVEDVDPDLDLAGSIAPMEPPSVVNRRGKRPLDDETNGTNGNGEHEGKPSGQNRGFEIDQHLSLLSQPPYNLTTKHVISGLPTWRVAFRGLARKLRHQELEKMIEARYGDVALRLIRILHDKGKLDEKRLQDISLLPFKDLRKSLAHMQTGGFVDLQEVPRDAQRQPSKTIYLWYYDPDRVCHSITEDTYKAMSRCIQRIKFERSRERDFLEKTERTDVKGHEEQLLSEAELQHLRNWRAREALLLAEVARLDEMVAVFRDY
ncbi:RNA polymerase III Rpc82 C -terminal [Penicillium sp. DV-2018c]|nr:RNA polymerase III Rpc82 C -terminal [Penicillium sp. DV-2018c]KAJ5576290.1 RNA polymerase III Rpc82 C -terminal [Penicillium sp. DV-2018c]